MRILKRVLVAALAAVFSATAFADAVAVFKAARTGVVTVVAGGDSVGFPAPVMPYDDPGDGMVLGSGIILPYEGFVLTANHAVADSRNIAVVFSDMSHADAWLVASEPLLDIALLSVAADARELAPLPWRLDTPLEVGEPVYAVGTPSAFSRDPTPSISAGIVSSLDRYIAPAGDRSAGISGLIESDCLITPGESGGALVDREGRLVGMCLAAHRPQDYARGRAYAIPTDAWLMGVIEALVRGEQAPLGDFGVQVTSLSEVRARSLSMSPGSGVEIAWVAAEGPFADAGILRGDVVVRINDQDVRQVTRFRQIEMRTEPGSRVVVRVVRPSADEPIDFEVVTGTRPVRARQADWEFVWRGMRLAGLTEHVRKSLGIHAHNGVVVMDVDPAGPAYRAGLRTGDVIVEINNIEVRSLGGFRTIATMVPAANVVMIRTTSGIGHVQGETRRR